MIHILNTTSFSNFRIAEIITSFGDDINPMMARILQDRNVTEKGKRIVVDVLASRNCILGLPIIKQLAYQAKDTELIIGCIKAMGQYGDPDSIDFLTFHLSSPNWIIRSQTVRALGEVCSLNFIPELRLMLLTEKHDMVKLDIARAINKFGERGKSELESVLSTHHDESTDSIVKYILYELEPEVS
jgi:HEAT repeat protein